MKLRPSLAFGGNAEDALAFYRAALGGEVSIFRFADTPAEAHAPAEWQQKVLYGLLQSPFGEISIMDAPPGRQGTPGDNFSISVDCDDIERAAKIFADLSAGGTIMMPWDETFFATRFGMSTDKFGIRWMISVPAPQPVAS